MGLFVKAFESFGSSFETQKASIDTDIADMILFTNPDSICVELLTELPNKPKKPADIFPFQQRGKRLCWRRGQAPTTSPLLL
ncbi:hypothetical protein LWI29_035599 [Acer saccharum]|uniref:Uncharacterized protein n=1 Tax=Acer saccharum TaxID=4024 RepID=A0AA39TKY2_ACESA|nr:hypothetical protein LWI29_035599 [Acer saccharum]